jgi:hypothetical protein
MALKKKAKKRALKKEPTTQAYELQTKHITQ